MALFPRGAVQRHARLKHEEKHEDQIGELVNDWFLHELAKL